MESLLLYEEYRLIERNDSEIHGAWKGAQLLFFFLAFVFGSFCTFCFHMMMYLFDEKCVLFPKLLSQTSLRHSVMYEFIPPDKLGPGIKDADSVPVDFLSTQWVENSTCYLPTYVPLVSGIFGLVWTTMFLMYSTGSRTLTGLQRPWRLLPLVFLFSLSMGSVCIYSSTITHYGLDELCQKLGEITGTTSCTYTINVATLAYNRRIHGVYQATRLTIISAWLHTACWILSALLALARVILVIDFQLVRISAQLQGDFDKMLERHEKQLRSVSPDANLWQNDKDQFKTSPGPSPSPSQNGTKVHFTKETFSQLNDDDISYLKMSPSELLYIAAEHPEGSELSLVPEERNKLARLKAYESVASDYKFIVKILYDFIETISLPDSESSTTTPSPSYVDSDYSTELKIVRQFGKEQIAPKQDRTTPYVPTEPREIVKGNNGKETSQDTKPNLHASSLQVLQPTVSEPSTSKKAGHTRFESSMNITSEMKRTLEQQAGKASRNTRQNIKSSLKHVGIQTAKKKKRKRDAVHQVKISDAKHVNTIVDKTNTASTSASSEEANKKVQTKYTDEEPKKETNKEIDKDSKKMIDKETYKDTDKVDKETGKETDEETDKNSKPQKKEKQD